jgi:hypothetical protein
VVTVRDIVLEKKFLRYGGVPKMPVRALRRRSSPSVNCTFMGVPNSIGGLHTVRMGQRVATLSDLPSTISSMAVPSLLIVTIEVVS